MTRILALGTNYFDAGLTELVDKLHLELNELDATEQKINLLTDNLTKVRAMNLKSELLNRRGNFAEALQLTQETAEQILVKTA